MNHRETQRRHKARFRAAILILLFALFLPSCARKPEERELRIAVASNFKAPAAVLVKRFEERSGNLATITLGSTGKLYAQIENGAPFDVFLAADAKRPELLEQSDPVAKGSRFTYAVGKLVLWSPNKDFADPGGKVLDGDDFSKLAIANPSLAPYGKAAEEVLKNRGLWEKLQDRIVRGENIGQTYQFVYSGNAEIGFLALSQVKDKGGSIWVVPRDLYAPIEQQAVLLSREKAARDFLNFLKSDEARKIIREHGYEVK